MTVHFQFKRTMIVPSNDSILTEPFIFDTIEHLRKGPHPWVHVKVGKFECIIYEDQSVPKYTNKKNESFNDLIQEILFPDSYGSQFLYLTVPNL